MTKDFDARNERKSRSVCAAMAESADTGKCRLTERERRILDMWPRFEDGEAVWFGDSIDNDGAIKTVQGFKLYRSGPAFLSVVGVDHEKWLRIEDYKSLKRTAPKVFDADGVEIEVGDTVYAPRIYGDTGFTVSRFAKNCDGDTIVMVEEMGSGLFPKTVTHTRPAYETRESVVYEIGEDMAKRIDAIVSAGRWK